LLIGIKILSANIPFYFTKISVGDIFQAMRVKVYAPAIIDHCLLDKNGFLEVEEGATLNKVFALLKVPLVLRPVLLYTVNYDRVKLSTRLKEGDVISIIAPISGG
jgi:molybdopterin converting factor small subunit